jgi:hypothetical protein
MWPTRMDKVADIEAALEKFSKSKRQLPGVKDARARRTFAMQLVASLRRFEYTEIIRQRPIDSRRTDPNDPLFDPERAAILCVRDNNIDEAAWLVFLMTHFGKNLRHGWRRLKDVYSGLGEATWTWEQVSQDVDGFRSWLQANESRIGGAFGNHRKYESLSGNSGQGTGAVIASYVDWVGPQRSHKAKFSNLIRAAGNDPYKIFDHFYEDMSVRRFGRLGKFDLLALLGRLQLAPLQPGSTYLKGATGPLNGAYSLFGKKAPIPDLEDWLRELGDELKVGMQVMEDALCNWQKSPTRFIHFRG